MKEKAPEVVKCMETLRTIDRDLVISADGSVREAAPLKGCVVSYVNCRTKKTEIVSLKPGDTFAYGDWNGTRCVRKVFQC